MTDTADFERERRARLANMRQELLAPVTALVGYGEMLVEEARRLELAPVLPDLERILTSARDLLELVHRLLDVGGIAGHQSGADLAELQAKLRHDLRNPLNAIKGYAELLLEDVDELDAQATRPDLEQLLSEAESLRSRIDGIVDFSDQEGHPQLEGEDHQTVASMVANLVQTVRPIEEYSAPPHETGRILVVDDNASNRDLLFRRLSHDGHQVSRADSGRRALEILEVEDFDLVLLDLLIPDLNGFQVLARLKADERLHEIPVIMISGLQETDSVIRCIEAGAEDYLAADEGEAQEVEGLRFAEPAPGASGRRMAAELEQAGLVRMERQRELLQPRTHRVSEAVSVRLVLEADDDIISIADDDHVACGLAPSPALRPEIEHVVQIDVGEQRRDHRSLPGSRLADHDGPVLQNTRLQPLSDEADDAPVADPVLHEASQPGLTDRVEERSNIGVQDVVHLPAADPDHQRIQRIVLAAPGPEPIREPEELLLVDRVQHGGRRPLDDLVLEGGHRQRALAAIRFRDVPSS
jgi:CheY-like chemotaxis protein